MLGASSPRRPAEAPGGPAPVRLSRHGRHGAVALRVCQPRSSPKTPRALPARRPLQKAGTPGGAGLPEEGYTLPVPARRPLPAPRRRPAAPASSFPARSSGLTAPRRLLRVPPPTSHAAPSAPPGNPHGTPRLYSTPPPCSSPRLPKPSPPTSPAALQPGVAHVCLQT